MVNETLEPEFITPKLEGLIAQVEKEIVVGKVSGPFNNVEDFIKDLKSESE